MLSEHIKNEDYDKAYVEACEILFDDPNNINALFTMGYIHQKANKFAIAQVFYEKVVKLDPKTPSSYMNLGLIYDKMNNSLEALKYFKKALSLAKKNGMKSELYGDLANTYLNLTNPEKALECVHKALSLNPFNKVALVNESFAYLQQKKWGKGWDSYIHILGTKHRPEQVYGDETRWNGEKGKNVIIYGEQGLGDEIMYSSVIPDMAQDNTVLLECDPRLQTLFKRSFPNVHVSGTRGKDTTVNPGIEIDHRACISDLCRIYRRTDESFPRKPFLVPDEKAVKKWKEVFKEFNKPVIGISWTGGRIDTGGIRRKPLKDWEPILELDAIFVNLNYKDKDVGSYPIIEYEATALEDYDETASLVAALDMVITVPTTICHLAGGLGVETLVMVPDHPRWSYGLEGENHPWYDSVKVFRDWATVTKQVSEYLHDQRNIPKAKREFARKKPSVRNERKTVGFIGRRALPSDRN